jgi:anti-sigma-K factor RskA
MWQESAAAYALDALEGAELQDFEALLGRSTEARREVAELQEVVAFLAYAAPVATPPASLRERVLREARQVRPIAAAQKPNANRLGMLVPYFALAAALAGIIVLGTRYVAQRDTNRTLAAAADTLRQALASRDVIIDALLAPEVATVKLSATGSPPSARMYWNRATGQVILAAFQLPPAREGRTYQLWGIARGGAPVSLGTFNTLATGEARHVVTAPAGLTIAVGAVTEEPAGGSPQPTATPFLVGQVN